VRIGLVLSNTPQPSETFLTSFIEIISSKHELYIYANGKYKLKKNRIICRSIIKGNIESLILSPKILFTFIANYSKYRKLRSKGLSIKQGISDLFVWTEKNLDYLHFGFGSLIVGREYYGEVMGCKLSLSFRGSDINVYPIWHQYTYNLALEKATKIQANARELILKLEKYSTNILEKSVIINPGLQPLYFLNSDKLFELNQQRFGNQKLVIISIGRLHWVKGYELALETLYLFKNLGNNFEYRIIGDGKESEKLTYLIDFYNLNDNVKLLKTLSANQIKEQLAEANLFLQTSWSEGFSNSTIEAQAMGLPVVVTPVSGMKSIIKHKETGFISQSFTATEILHGLVWYQTLSKQELEKCSAEAMHRMHNKFSFENLSEKWLEFFN
jgi:colanic acid/amylovoran biosynthesis glycosyltransferase